MKKILFLAVLVMTAMSAMASPVDVMSAKATAQKYLLSQPGKGNLMSTGADGLRLIYEEKSAVNTANAAFYIFNSKNGFVVVSGDDRARDILAYGDRPLDLNRMPENMKFWLSTYKRQIEYLHEHPGLVVDKQEFGKSLRGASVAPMLTAEWDQDAPYYNHCPKYNGSYCLTGCPATSLSMVFYYWKYPYDETPAVEGYINDSYGFQVEALPPITFDWDNMLDKYTGSYNTAQADAVAWLMRYVGQAEHMDYTPSASGAMGEDILRAVKFYGYDEETARLEFKTRTDDYGTDTAVYYTDDEWADLLQTELAEGRPVVYCAYDYSSWWGWSGHAFNVDGYNANSNTYHVNWGWSGDGNGDFALNAFSSDGYTFNIEQQMIMGIQPPVLGPTIKASPSTVNIEAYVEQSATATFTVKGQELSDAITLTLNDESGSFSIDASSVALAEQEAGKVITVTYAPQASGTDTATITLSSPGVDDKTITINGIATLETYLPVMLPADEAFINLTQFRADWTDETADKYVDSYTLEVNTKPAVQLLDSINATGSTSGYESITLTAPWSGNGTKVGNGAIYFSNYSGDGYISYTIPDGYINDVFTMQITTVDSFYGSGNLTVGSDQTAPVGHQFSVGETHTWLVMASEGEKITITSTDDYFSPDMSIIKVYVGDINDLRSFNAVEEGDANYRLVTGINDKSYLVKNLAEAGTFFYRVKALYTDGTQSPWSKSQSVTLFANGHAYQLGDVDHDGAVTISDVTELIDYLLRPSADICSICADVNADGDINITDVTDLIDMLLSGH